MLTKNDLDSDIAKVLAVYETLAGPYALKAKNIIDTQDPINALVNLVVTPELENGFKILREQQVLREASFEKLVIKYAVLFPEEAIAIAKMRLDDPYEQI